MHFCWFVIDKAKLTLTKFQKDYNWCINIVLNIFFQGQMYKREKAIPEILVWCEKFLNKLTDDEDDDDVISFFGIIDFFQMY